MRLDFSHTSVRHDSRTPSLHPFFVRGVLFGVFFFGITAILWLLLSLLGGSGENTPYAYSFFSRDGDETAQTMTILWVNEKKKELSFVTVPQSVQYTSPTIGSYPISGTYRAYVQSHVQKNTMTTELSIFFRTRVDDVILSSKRISQDKRSLLSSTLQSCLQSDTSIRPSFSHCLEFIGILLSPTYRLREVPFPEHALARADAVGLQRLERTPYSVWLADHFSYSFGFDRQTISVVNASGTSGVAKRASVVFRDLGFSVLNVTDASKLQEDGELIISDSAVAEPQLLSFFASFFGVSQRIDKNIQETYRTQVVFVIGKKQVGFFTP